MCEGRMYSRAFVGGIPIADVVDNEVGVSTLEFDLS
jgi:hypothetical protein